MAFSENSFGEAGIGSIFVINLDRELGRWRDVLRELDGIVDAVGKPLSARAVRQSAFDAQNDPSASAECEDVSPFYTLGDQLAIEPQPHAIPDLFDLESPIRMSNAEIAIARSHIEVWKEVAESPASYALILEDDVWFRRSFARSLEQAWREMADTDLGHPGFDILYVSYAEVRHGAPKEFISPTIFRPERGLWYMSGYILSKKGARALLNLLPCRGPVDLWLNHKFRELDVRALRQSVISQRRDLYSTNSYSVLPALTRIGVLNGGDAALYQRRPTHLPVFGFGAPEAGLSALAMALSMLGYRCCSDLDSLPEREFENLLAGRTDRVFDAYVNVGSLEPKIDVLKRRFPNAKFIVLGNPATCPDMGVWGLPLALRDSDLLHLQSTSRNWRALCGHLRLAPPDGEYPTVPDIGIRKRQVAVRDSKVPPPKWLPHDVSPWVARFRSTWAGIDTSPESLRPSAAPRIRFEDDLNAISAARWLLRNDTFSGNLALFRPANVVPSPTDGILLRVAQECLGVRAFSAGAMTSRESFLFGRFQCTLRATNVPGLVTGFFLHRNSPRQEIDVEIRGNRPDELLVNVFYNPGDVGAHFDYGYRGTPAIINLGFDASQGFHQFTIEWNPCEIRWFVDEKLVHRRVSWNPTPIPHLPMTLHVNTWPSQSRELAGRLSASKLPASTMVRSIAVDALSLNPPHECTSLLNGHCDTPYPCDRHADWLRLTTTLRTCYGAESIFKALSSAYLSRFERRHIDRSNSTRNYNFKSSLFARLRVATQSSPSCDRTITPTGSTTSR